jgi:hypothetical protein
MADCWRRLWGGGLASHVGKYDNYHCDIVTLDASMQNESSH